MFWHVKSENLTKHTPCFSFFNPIFPKWVRLNQRASIFVTRIPSIALAGLLRFLLFVASFSKTIAWSSFTPVNDLRLWDKYAGGVSGHHLSSTWRACYKLFFIGWKSIRCSFKLNTGYPVLFLSNRKNTFFSDMLMRMWTQMFECQNLLRHCVSFGPCVCWNMLSYASIICWSSLIKEGRRG